MGKGAQLLLKRTSLMEFLLEGISAIPCRESFVWWN